MSWEYDPAVIEAEAQAYWQERNTFEVERDPQREPFFCLSMLPYPSGRLHMGHVRNYSIGDALSRYQRMRGRNVLQPIGWDAFGLPAENAAIKNKTAPALWTRQSITGMREQLKSMGFAYDWRREFATCEPEYYRWEQWLFLQMYQRGLVYRRETEVNWDPVDQTVLANEQVVDGRGWRSGAVVERRRIPQWFVRITDYAQELLDGLDDLEHWPQTVRTMQRNWIGRSEGLQVRFTLADGPVAERDWVDIFTTRPDTLAGVTLIAISPEHPLALEVAKDNEEVAGFIASERQGMVAERARALADKRGVALGRSAINPVNDEPIPIWVANFVLMDYGSGAVMCVPAHDQRDWEFANAYNLPIRQVVQVDGGDLSQSAITEHGILCDSGRYDGMDFPTAFAAIAKDLEGRDLAERQVQFRLRDWGVSRQRYWGAPIPFIHCDACGAVPVPEADLPVVLPEDVEFSGLSSPLADIPEFYHVSCPKCGADAHRETDTFDTFFESSWYYARYTCPDHSAGMLDSTEANYWLPVAQYIGGVEHAILHLLYARFFHKVMRDVGLVESDEPFARLLTQGMVLRDGAKMSKSRGNTVDPDTLIAKYGADTVRMFSLFAAPPERSLEWSDQGVQGASRFIRRLWSSAEALAHTSNLGGDAGLQQPGLDLQCKLHQTLIKVGDDYERRLTFNTAIASVMELLNAVPSNWRGELPQAEYELYHEVVQSILLLLSPIVPHVCHALWQRLGYAGYPEEGTWPEGNPQLAQVDTVEYAVQVNGKLRGSVQAAADASQDEVQSLALEEASVQRHLGKVVKVIFVPGRLINLIGG